MARANAPALFSPTTRASARDSLSSMPSNGTPMAKTPPGGALSGAGAAELLQGMLMGASSTAPAEEADRVSRKDKSLGLLCDNFLQLFACGFSATVELEPVANRLGVGRRRIYDIVNVLESLDVVQKDRASSYTWFGLTQLPRCVVQLEAVSAGAAAVKLLPDCPLGEENTDDAGKGGRRGGRDDDEHEGGRKEKSIKELSVKFVGLFLQSVNRHGQDGVLSLDQAARSLLVHQAGGAPREPEPAAMKTKVRRLYDICNVLTSLKMIEKVRLGQSSKPAFRWCGVTQATYAVFDATSARHKPTRQYGGATAAAAAAACGGKRTAAEHRQAHAEIARSTKHQKRNLAKREMMANESGPNALVASAPRPRRVSFGGVGGAAASAAGAQRTRRVTEATRSAARGLAVPVPTAISSDLRIQPGRFLTRGRALSFTFGVPLLATGGGVGEEQGGYYPDGIPYGGMDMDMGVDGGEESHEGGEWQPASAEDAGACTPASGSRASARRDPHALQLAQLAQLAPCASRSPITRSMAAPAAGGSAPRGSGTTPRSNTPRTASSALLRLAGFTSPQA